MNIVETWHLSQRYWTRASLRDIFPANPALAWRTPVLHDLTLAVPAGSVYAVLGANGAGKTTLLKVLMNLLPPCAGVARVLGVDSRRLGAREFAQIGYVAENQRLPEWMTVQQFIGYCRPLYPTWDCTLEAALLARFDLPVDRRLSELSRGMRMKTALLASLAYRPGLLVLDEPFTGLDPVARDDVTHGLLESVRQGETTVLISSHDIEEVERLADRVALLEAGRLRFAEATEALLGRFRRIEVEQEGVWAGDSLPPAWLSWRSGGGRISFVDSAYDRQSTESLCRKHFPFATVQAYPLTLREIFLALARPDRPSTQATAP